MYQSGETLSWCRNMLDSCRSVKFCCVATVSFRADIGLNGVVVQSPAGPIAWESASAHPSVWWSWGVIKWCSGVADAACHRATGARWITDGNIEKIR